MAYKSGTERELTPQHTVCYNSKFCFVSVADWRLWCTRQGHPQLREHEHMAASNFALKMKIIGYCSNMPVQTSILHRFLGLFNGQMLVPGERDRLTALTNTSLLFSYNTDRVLAEQLKAPVPRMFFYWGKCQPAIAFTYWELHYSKVIS